MVDVDETKYLWLPCKRYVWADSLSYATTKASVGTWDCDASAGPGPAWQRKVTYNSYNLNGQVLSDTDARGNSTTFAYNNDGQLTQVAKGSLSQVFTYEPYWGLLATLRDENLNTTTFAYDNHARLKEVFDRFNNKVAAYAYTFPRTAGAFVSTNPNWVKTTKYSATSTTHESYVFYDGLGRPIQTQVRYSGGTSGLLAPENTEPEMLVTATEYNLLGLVYREWKPYTYTGVVAYDPYFATNARARYGTSTNPYTETLYKVDGLERESQIKPENDGTTIPVITRSYLVGPISGKNYSYVETTDEMGRKTRAFTDTFGQPRQQVNAYGTTEAATTSFTYDIRDNLLQATDPRGLITSYLYNTQGQLRQKTSPDAGVVRYLYDAAGNLRYSRDANQNTANRVSFYQYDLFNRPTANGEATGVDLTAFKLLNPDATASWETSTNYVGVNYYDAKPPTTGSPWNIFSTEITSATLTYLSGHQAAQAFKSGADTDAKWQLTLFSYDKEERYDKKLLYSEDFGSPTKVKTELKYTYD